MRQIETDVLVIGGGSTGTGVVWDAALRGFRADLMQHIHTENNILFERFAPAAVR